MSQLYIHEKFGKNQTTGSQDIVHTRKCDTDTNRIRTKNNMSPSPKLLIVTHLPTHMRH